ncbi:MAG: dimethyl sulfoxide reductase anchor subunit [Deltaproteobacteria bacterium]|nr:dimethyl sulfoxide reductase anchor subunit [Deltaproteobacteria bacterium]
MSTAIRSSLLAVIPPERVPSLPTTTPASPAKFSALDWVLADQQTLTAVDRFARKHDDAELPTDAKIYRDLIPGVLPGAGQQYAFEVDLDLCTGCKACVTGCHNLNGLDDGEVWRTVGLLHGGTAAAPAQQTVTTACHHCLEPACLSGCPVKAYEKDPVTGIVKHLDDQCIGCQYCILMCPYDAPKYSKDRGIVRKCDMCSDRLSHGEAPACVQSCPNEAIRIAVVDRGDAIQATEANSFLPGAPSPSDTLPTTVYKTDRALPRNMLPADFYSVSREHAHPPLVVMLGLTQLSVGAFIVNLVVRGIVGSLGDRALEMTNALFALALGLIALGVMPLHLGRPRYAFRALLGLRTSWLSREILAFSLFAGLATAYASSFFVPGVPMALKSGIGMAAGAAGILGVVCSVMVYAATRRAHWRGSVTGFKFTLSTIVLGAATVLMISMIASTRSAVASGVGVALASEPPFVSSGAYEFLAVLLLASAALKLGYELSGLRHLRAPHHSVAKRIAILLVGDLGSFTRARFWFGALGGLALPTLGLFLLRFAATSSAPFPIFSITVISAASFALCLAGELLERYLFFASAPASKMPGGII